jgi:hypothetical protein
MRGYLGGALALALACGGIAAAEPAPLAGKGDAVTITGCVLAGTQDSSVVLTHVSEAAAGGGPREAWLGAEGMAEPGGEQQVAYWLNHESVKKVREHIGHRVEIKGHVSDVSQGSVTVDREPGKEGRDNKVVVEGRGKEATAKTEKSVTGGPAAAPGTHSEVTKPMSIHRIDVDSVRMLSTTCP